MSLLDNAAANTAHTPISKDEAQSVLRTGEWQESAALKLVCQDAVRSEAYMSSKQWVTAWQQASTLYQSPFSARFWEGTQTERSNIPSYVLASAVNSLVPQVINGLFSENPPFVIQQRSGTTADQADAVGAVLGFQLDDINFKEELRLGATNAILYGTAIWKWGWETYQEEHKILVRKKPVINQPNPIAGGQNLTVADDEEDSIEEEVTKITIDRPFFQHLVNLKYILPDPTLSVPDISKGKFVIERMYMTYYELDELRDRPGFNIPSKEKLLELFLPPKEPVAAAIVENTSKNPQWDMRAESRYEEATIDPFQEPLEVLWRWDKKSCIVVLQKKLVICNDDNPFGQIPYLSVGWWDVPESFYSMGLAKTIGAEQRLQQGIINTWLDNAALNLNGVYKRVKGKSTPTQSIRIAPGKIVEVDNKDDFSVLDRLPAVPEAGEHIQMSQSRVDQLSGAGALNTSGSSAGHSNLARSATGANALISGGTTVPDFIDKLSNQVIIPTLNNFHQMNFALLPQRMMKRILNEELQSDYAKNNDPINLYNARVKFSILAGAKMQAKQKMAAQLPLIIQFLTNEQTTQQLAISGHRVNVLRLMKDLYTVGEWKDVGDVIVKMNPDEMQRAQMNSPAAKMQAQAQMAQQQMEQKKNNQLDIVDAENQARAGREVLRSYLEKSENPEALTGGPQGNVGFTQQ